uniref:Uncharacterized protein n=1 Tax=Arundo donax TaxID=35708 RepID=A0A0A9E9Z7_ARUDO
MLSPLHCDSFVPTRPSKDSHYCFLFWNGCEYRVTLLWHGDCDLSHIFDCKGDMLLKNFREEVVWGKSG